MAKGPIIKKNIRNEIDSLYLENPTLRAKEVQAELERRHGDIAPKLSAVQKELTKLRRDPGQLNKEIDQQWSLGSLSKYPIAAETIPVIIELQTARNNNGAVVGRSFLTIRQAQWIARLSPLLNSISSELPEGINIPGLLLQIAVLYARLEQIAEINQEILDTLDLDGLLFITKGYLQEKDELKREQLLNILSYLSNLVSEVI